MTASADPRNAAAPAPESAPTEPPASSGGPSRLSRAWSSWPGRVARVLFALLPLVWLTRKFDWRDVWLRAVDVGAWGLGAAFLAVMASLSVGSLRWAIMLRAYGAETTPRFTTMLRHNLVGMYFNVLPSGVAGDAVRGHRVRHTVGSVATSYTVIFVERVAGLMGLLLIAGGAMLSSADLQTSVVTYVMDLGLVGGLGLTLVAFVLPYVIRDRPELRARVAALPAVGPVLVRIPPARSLAGPVAAVALSVLTQGAIVLAVAALIAPLAPAATLAVCARVVPAVILFTYIPLTPGGMGQREAAFAYLFGLAHVAPASAVATSLLFFAVIMCTAALGGLCLLAERVLELDP